MAITEAHAGASRDEQLRWLHEVWCAAEQVVRSGVDVRAVTAWSLFGAFDWDSLVTQSRNHYEPGAFDVRSRIPRATAVARMISALSGSGCFEHPVLHEAGWWKRESRYLFDGSGNNAVRTPLHANQSAGAGRPILITGANGTLGSAFARVCEERGLATRICARAELDIADPASIAAVIEETSPWAVVNAAGYVRVDMAEAESNLCFRNNRDGAIALARACEVAGCAFVTFSSDLVFDGCRRHPYVESDGARPLSVYGLSKLEAEQHVLSAMPGALVIRTSAFFGPWDEHNFVAHVLRSVSAATPVAAADDEVVSPTFIPDLVHTSLDLLIDGECGIWHLANDGAVSWAELASLVTERAGGDRALIQHRPGRSLERAARRPRYSVLGTERGVRLPSLNGAIDRFFAARAATLQGRSS